MTLASTVALTKRVPAGEGVSYLHRYVTERETTLALVPLGYADGVPRAATNIGQVQLGGAAAPSRAPSAWTSSCWTSATTRWPPATRCCCSGPGQRGGADGAGLGGGARHHQLRDRHARRCPVPRTYT
jgi:hypothetical protein